MGPTNVALVKLFKADKDLREAQERYDAASKGVRVQERRVNDLAEKQKLSSARLLESKSQSANIELDLKSRDEHIDKLRTQQQVAKNNKEYQAFLIEINTEKLDKTKIEEDLMKLMEQGETLQTETSALGKHLDEERAKLDGMKQEIGGQLTQMQKDIDARRPALETARAGTPPKAREQFERLADRHDGEAMAAIVKPDKRREEYVCGACHMELVVDLYNKLHSRDELFFCPSCRRILFIPEDLPPEAAVNKKKVTKPRKAAPEMAAAPRRGESAIDVLNSTTPDEPDDAPDETSGEADPTDSPDPSAPPSGS